MFFQHGCQQPVLNVTQWYAYLNDTTSIMNSVEGPYKKWPFRSFICARCALNSPLNGCIDPHNSSATISLNYSLTAVTRTVTGIPGGIFLDVTPFAHASAVILFTSTSANTPSVSSTPSTSQTTQVSNAATTTATISGSLSTITSAGFSSTASAAMRRRSSWLRARR